MTRASSKQRSGDEWHKQRMRALVRDNFTCRWPDG